MFGVMILLLYAYAFEYVKYRTSGQKFRRRFNILFLVWIVLIGIYTALRYSVFGLIVLPLAVIAYYGEKYFVNRIH